MSTDDDVNDCEGMAAVTSYLAERIMYQAAIDVGLGGSVMMTSTPLGELLKDGQPTEKTINLFPFQINPSPALRNQPLPEQVPERTNSYSPLPLDLTYAVTIHFPKPATMTEDIDRQRLLGAMLLKLHENPVLRNPITIPRSSGPSVNPTYQYNFAEKVRVSLVPTTTDDLHKIWGALQVPIQYGFFLRVSVVFLARKKTPALPQPVLYRGPGDRGWDVTPNALGIFPRLEEWECADPDPLQQRRHATQNPRFEPSETVRLRGYNLVGRDSTFVSAAEEPKVVGKPPKIRNLKLKTKSSQVLEFMPVEDDGTLLPFGSYRSTVICKDSPPGTDEKLRRSEDFLLAVSPQFKADTQPDLGTITKTVEVDVSFAVDPDIHDTAVARFGRFELKLKSPGHAHKSPFKLKVPHTATKDDAGVYAVRLLVNGVENLPLIMDLPGVGKTVVPGPTVKVVP